MELLPTKATFSPDEPIEVEVREAAGPVTVSLWRLDHKLAESSTSDEENVVRFPTQREGGYGIEAPGATAALDVLADPLSRPRYGFVSHFEAGRDPAGVVDNARRLHLNAVLFYDWMYRHAALVPPGPGVDEYEDALGLRISLETVRRLAAAMRSAGSLPLAYAAVYAVGSEAWPQWRDDGLYHADGSPWTLGDEFLWIVDPSSERWLTHFGAELRAAQEIGFAGFHLDQYGAPKRALRRDGSRVDLADAFPALIDRVAREVPGARLVFNNVNDFPTWTTASASQDVVYIEAWPPHTRLGHLAELITKARALAPAKPVVLAAYLSTYRDDEPGGSAAERLQLATVFSHGATVIAHGEEGAALSDPYYVRHTELGPRSIEATRRYYDFAVRYGDLLFDRGSIDVTRSHLGGENVDVGVEAPVPVATDCTPGALWVRVLDTSLGRLVSLIDLSPQADDLWDAPKRPGRMLAGVRVALDRAHAGEPRFAFADPDDTPALRTLVSHYDGRFDIVELPAFRTWALLWVRPQPIS